MNRRLAAGLCLAAALLLAACSSSDPEVGGPPRGSEVTGGLEGLMLASAAKVAEATTSRFELTMTMPGPGGAPVEVTSRGAVDNATGLMSMEVDLAAIGLAGVDGADGTTTALFDGENLYYRFPAVLRHAFGGKEWVRMRLATLSELGDFDVEAVLGQFKQSDPAANLALMTGAASELEEVGTEVVRGVGTRHVRMTVDLQRAMANTPEPVRETVAQMVEILGTSTYPAELWIADDGLPRRLAYRLDLSRLSVPGAEAGAVPAGEIHFVMELFDFGADVGVNIPPASEVADIADFLHDLGPGPIGG